MSRLSADFTILASAVVVLGGVVAMVRAIWRAADTVRLSTRATAANTAVNRELSQKIDHLSETIDSRFDTLTERVARLEGRRR